MGNTFTNIKYKYFKLFIMWLCHYANMLSGNSQAMNLGSEFLYNLEEKLDRYI